MFRTDFFSNLLNYFINSIGELFLFLAKFLRVILAINLHRVQKQYLPAFFYLFLSLTALFLFGEERMVTTLADDAYYYIVVARNIVASGESAFLTGHPTNGYHPVWLLMLSVVGYLFGFSLTVVGVLECILIFFGFVFLIKLFKIKKLSESFFYTIMLWFLLQSFSLRGMETTALFPAFVLFFSALLSEDEWFRAHRSLKLILLSSLVIGTRLDAAFFVIPILICAPFTYWEKLKIITSVFLCGVLYIAFNLYMFGTALPISGAIKSLGGFQLNLLYLQQIKLALTWQGFVGLDSAISPWLTACFAILAVLFVAKAESHRTENSLLIASLIVLVIYSAKILFFSSWAIWHWYGYPALVFALLTIWITVDVPKRRVVLQIFNICSIVFGILFLFFYLTPVVPRGFPEINRRFVVQHEDLLAGRILAMGDRAGSLSYNYGGSVYQVEGLLNDVEFLHFIKTDGNLREHLCNKGIEVFLDFEPANENYNYLDIEIFRPLSSQFHGPTIRVHQTEEIATYSDPSVFSFAQDWMGDSQLYAWKLDCPN